MSHGWPSYVTNMTLRERSPFIRMQPEPRYGPGPDGHPGA